MNLSKVLKQVRQEARISDVFPITHLNTPNIFESQSGFLGAVLRLQGVAFEIEEPETMNFHKMILHQVLLGLDARFIVYVTLHRQKSSSLLSGEFSSAFANELNEHYQKRFKNQNLYCNRLYMTVVLKGDDSHKGASFLRWAKHISGKNLAVQGREA